MPANLNFYRTGRRAIVCVLFVAPFLFSPCLRAFGIKSKTVIPTRIAPKSRSEWSKCKKEVCKLRDKLNKQIEGLKPTRQNRPASNFTQEMHELAARISSLNTTLKNLDSLEASEQIYALKDTTMSSEGETLTRCIIKDKDTIIEFLIANTATFVHETTHGGQFEAGKIAFSRITRSSLANDLYDERDAYKAQYAFDPDFFSKYTSSSVISTSASITPGWVQNLVNPDSCRPYDTCDCISVNGKPCRSANAGLTAVTIYSVKAELKLAYPKPYREHRELQDQPASYTLSKDPNVYIAPSRRH